MFWLPLTTTPSPLSLPSSHPALPLLRCLFLLQSLANVAVRCNLVFPHSSVLLLNGKARWNLSLSPIPHNIFLSYLISSIFCKNYPSYFLPVDTLICPVYSSLLLCIIFVMFEVVTCSHFLILGHHWHHIRKRHEAQLQRQLCLHTVRRLGGFQGCLQPPGETQGKWLSANGLCITVLGYVCSAGGGLLLPLISLCLNLMISQFF